MKGRSSTHKSKILGLDAARSRPGPDRRRRLVLFVAVTLIGILVTCASFVFIRDEAQSDGRMRFEQQASTLSSKLQSEYDLALETLLAIPSFFAATDAVTSEDFSTFVSPALDRHPSVYAFAFLPRIDGASRAEFEKDAGFDIKGVNEKGQPVAIEGRDEHFPITFCEPMVPSVLGVDLGVHPEQGIPIARARAIEGPVATPPLSLIEDPEDVLSVITFTPVRFQRTRGRGDCDGLAEMILRIQPVVENALGPRVLDDFELALTYAGAGSERRLLYKNFPGTVDGSAAAGEVVASRTVRFADQEWNLTLAPSPGSPYAIPSPPYWILGAGLALSLLAAYSLSTAFRIGRLQERVDAALELGQYRLGEVLGEGGMGTVYEAEHRMLARPAAIKLIRMDELGIGSGDGAAGEWLSRFEREARATALLQSPHTISIFDYGMTESGVFYYVMERLQGTDLATLVEETGPMSPSRAIHVLVQICESLAEAHDAGLVHRDIKPANVFLCKLARKHDFVKVLDFGLVKTVASDEGLTMSGTALGTPQFMAPEMIRDEPVDHRADIYALGCVAYFLLEGRPLFGDRPLSAVLAAHLTEVAPNLAVGSSREIPEDLADIVMRCLAKNPDERPQTAQSLRDMLESVRTKPWSERDASKAWIDQVPQKNRSKREHEETLYIDLDRSIDDDSGIDDESNDGDGTARITRSPSS